MLPKLLPKTRATNLLPNSLGPRADRGGSARFLFDDPFALVARPVLARIPWHTAGTRSILLTTIFVIRLFTMGGKGGVGKTGLMVALAEWFEANEIPRPVEEVLQ